MLLTAVSAVSDCMNERAEKWWVSLPRYIILDERDVSRSLESERMNDAFCAVQRNRSNPSHCIPQRFLRNLQVTSNKNPFNA